MATVISLNKARKQKARIDEARQAAENRVKFGRSKVQKQRDAAEATESKRKLDLLKREPAQD